MTDIVICIPAWGERACSMAQTLVIPAVMKALSHVPHAYKFIIWTDNENHWLAPDHTEFRKCPQNPEDAHAALTEMHTRVLSEASEGQMICLLNADIVPSEELFAFGQFVLSNYKVIASFGLRTLWKDGMEPPPIQTGKQLLEWGWKHKHPVVNNCIWGAGRTSFPVTLFFVNGHSNAIAHCSHLHPFLIRKDNRELDFRGTIDDGLLHLYGEAEVFYPVNRELGFVEMSDHALAPHFMGVRDEMLDEEFVIEFGKHYLTTHCRNLRKPFRIAGEGPVYDMPASTIAERIKGNQ